MVAFLQESKLMKVLREGGKHETWLMCYLADPPQNCDWITTEYIKDGESGIRILVKWGGGGGGWKGAKGPFS